MNVGVGLPNAVPGRGSITAWARRAEECGFSSLGVVDRIAYDSIDPFTALAAAATATTHIGLATTVAIGPLRAAALLTKEVATVHALAINRLTVGLGIGARTEDFEVAGVDHRRRGSILDDQLYELRRLLGDEDPGEPKLLVGGTSDVAFARAARAADGYVHGGGPPRAFATAALKARTAWRDYARRGDPLLWGQGYFALGREARDAGLAYMRDYYAFTGPFAERIAEGMLNTPQDVAQLVRGYSEAGCDELVLMPAVPSIDQLSLLADVLAGVR
jgi:alkanesulfonate monooxygenase SsuD/methylene tetrahydromethanopterin reductase-like flavin-dependent oxidoreductase (luciferase family)